MPTAKHKTEDYEDVKAILLRMGESYVEDLDQLCTINRRSRREIVELLIDIAINDLAKNPKARINPL